MSSWKFRVGGLVLMILGCFLFVWSVKYVQSEWPQIFSGLLSVFTISIGFALLIMPLGLHEESSNSD